MLWNNVKERREYQRIPQEKNKKESYLEEKESIGESESTEFCTLGFFFICANVCTNMFFRAKICFPLLKYIFQCTSIFSSAQMCFSAQNYSWDPMGCHLGKVALFAVFPFRSSFRSVPGKQTLSVVSEKSFYVLREVGDLRKCERMQFQEYYSALCFATVLF